MENRKEIIMGALIGTVVGSLSSLLVPKEKLIKNLKNHGDEWMEKAKEMGEHLYKGAKSWRQPPPATHVRDFGSGAVIGLLLGAASTLFLNPKSGKQLLKDISHKYNDLSDKTHHFMDSLNKEKLPTKVRTKVAAKKKTIKRKLKKVVR